MGFRVIVSPRAQKEIENAVDYYALYSSTAPKNFVQAIKEAYSALALNPFHMVLYGEIRCLKINKFPYTLFFTTNEKKGTVKILSCFHNKLNPSKMP